MAQSLEASFGARSCSHACQKLRPAAQNQPLGVRPGHHLATRALSFFNTGWKATTFTRDCPQQILVLDITPLDTAWAHIQEHASPQPLNASNASWACATRGVDVRSGKSRCCTSECHITKVAEHAIRALKGEVRSVFAPQLTFSRPQSLRNREFLTMHATEHSHEAQLLRAVLSKYNLSSENACMLPSTVSSKLPTALSRGVRLCEYAEL